MPIPRTALIGRERDLVILESIFSDPQTRLLTLSGVGGCGKTRLALQIASDLAEQYHQRSFVIELASLSDPKLIPIVVSESIGLSDSRTESVTEDLVQYLSERPALLLFDNCEHLVDACAQFVDTLLVSCPELRVLATSREPLHIDGERQYRVPPLDLPDVEPVGSLEEIAASSAVQLFVARAQSVQPSFRLASNNAEAVARICIRLEGIPLALELAAARINVLGIQQILERLDHSFDLLVGDSRVAPTRHQTLHATLAWSDGLLSDNERAVWQRLAVFSGEFQLEAVEAVCTDDEILQGDMLGIVSELTDKSLVVTESGAGAAWHRLLEPVRQFAREGLGYQVEDSLRSRHAAFYLDLAESSAAGLRGPEQQHWLDRLERDQGNVRAALEWTRQNDPNLELRLAVALSSFWEMRGYTREGLRRLREALHTADLESEDGLRMQALSATARLALYFNRSESSNDFDLVRTSQEIIRLARELGEDYAVAFALKQLGIVYREQRAYTRSISSLEEALAIFRTLEDENNAARVLLHLGLAIYRAEESPEGHAKATRLLDESSKGLQDYGDDRGVAAAQVLLGRMSLDHGEPEQAVRMIVDGMDTHLRVNDQFLVASDLLVLSEVMFDAGQPQPAVRFVAAAEAVAEQLDVLVEWTPFADEGWVRMQVDGLRNEPWFEAVWTEGGALEPSGAVQAARSLLEDLERSDQSTSDQTSSPESLTPRELEVTRLLAEGYTDRQIADALFIAPSTVGTHVHHILQKLHLRSRTQVADWLATQETDTSETT